MISKNKRKSRYIAICKLFNQFELEQSKVRRIAALMQFDGYAEWEIANKLFVPERNKRFWRDNRKK